MKKSAKQIVSFLSLLPVCACTLGNDVNPVYVVQPLVNDQRETGVEAAHSNSGIPGPIDLDTFVLWGQKDPAVDTIQQDILAGTTISLAQAKEARNDLKSALVQHSDLICAYTEAQMEGNSDIANFSTGIVASGAGALGAIFTQATPARIFSGVSGFANSTQTAINQDFFKNALTFSIIEKIDSSRTAQLSIINGHNDDDINTYTLSEMLSDVFKYHNACSFYEGIVAIESSSSNSSASDSSSPSGGGTSQTKQTVTTNSSNAVQQTPNPTSTGQPSGN